LAVAFVGLSGFTHTSLAAGSATLYLTPASGSYTVGQTVIATIYTNTGGDPVNAVEADFSYPSSKLQFQSIDTSSSAFGITASGSGGGGTVTIARGNTSALTGTELVAAVHFTVLASGSASLSFLGSSAVVRSTDNTNILNSTTGANYTLSAASTPAPTNTPSNHTPTPAPVVGKISTPTPKPSTGTTTTSPTASATPLPAGGTTTSPTATPLTTVTTATASPAPAHKSSTQLLGIAAIGIPVLALLALGAFLLSRSHIPDIAGHGSDEPFTPPTDTPTSTPPPPVPPASQSPNQIYYPDSNSKASSDPDKHNQP
jgi:hypothetical protein